MKVGSSSSVNVDVILSLPLVNVGSSPSMKVGRTPSVKVGDCYLFATLSER